MTFWQITGLIIIGTVCASCVLMVGTAVIMAIQEHRARRKQTGATKDDVR